MESLRSIEFNKKTVMATYDNFYSGLDVESSMLIVRLDSTELVAGRWVKCTLVSFSIRLDARGQKRC